jgi:hypothetical protein
MFKLFITILLAVVQLKYINAAGTGKLQNVLFSFMCYSHLCLVPFKQSCANINGYYYNGNCYTYFATNALYTTASKRCTQMPGRPGYVAWLNRPQLLTLVDAAFVCFCRLGF